MNESTMALYYAAVFVGGVFGVLFHIMGKVKDLRVKFPSNTPGQIITIFLNEEWNVLIVSGMVNLACLISVYFGAIHYFGWDEIEFGPLFAFVGMIGIGYFGQRLVYKWLGTTEKVLSKKLDNE